MTQQEQQKMALQIRRIQQRMKKIQEDLQQVNQQINRIDSTREGIEEISEKKEQEIISPVGEGVYMPAEIKNTEKTLVEAGAGVVIEKTPKKAINTLGDRKDSLIEARKNLKAQLQKLQNQYKQMASQMRPQPQSGQ